MIVIGDVEKAFFKFICTNGTDIIVGRCTLKFQNSDGEWNSELDTLTIRCDHESYEQAVGLQIASPYDLLGG